MVMTSPTRTLREDDLDALIERGGYTHPLFARGSANRPFPGQALLLVAGGLVEQTPTLPSGIIALLEFSRVTFSTMAFAPIDVRVEIEIEDPLATSRGDRVIWPMRWTLASEGATHLQADVRMLGSREPGPSR